MSWIPLSWDANAGPHESKSGGLTTRLPGRSFWKGQDVALLIHVYRIFRILSFTLRKEFAPRWRQFFPSREAANEKGDKYAQIYLALRCTFPLKCNNVNMWIDAIWKKKKKTKTKKKKKPTKTTTKQNKTKQKKNTKKKKKQKKKKNYIQWRSQNGIILHVPRKKKKKKLENSP